MQHTTVEFLDWDSNFFKKKVGRILFEENIDMISNLEFAKKKGYDLVYVFSRYNLYCSSDILSKFGGKLIDRKVQYAKKITTTISESNVSEYSSLELSEPLEQLAYKSGQYSRFRVDNQFQEDDFSRLYKIWIKKSIEKEIADKVYVVKENDAIYGMATLKIGVNKGEIGLIAVSDLHQGKGYGKALIEACYNDLLKRDINIIEVPTQFANKNACIFYEKCGFSIKSITNIYHFWL